MYLVCTSDDDGSSPKMRSTDQSLSLKVARAKAPNENSSLEEHHCLELFWDLEHTLRLVNNVY